MIQSRSLALYIVLSLITCGLFSIYWFISLAGDIAKLRQKPEPRGVFDFIIGLITCGIYFLVAYYNYSKWLVEIQEKRRVRVSDISIIAVILGIFGLGLVSMALIQNEVNKLSTAG